MDLVKNKCVAHIHKHKLQKNHYLSDGMLEK